VNILLKNTTEEFSGLKSQLRNTNDPDLHLLVDGLRHDADTSTSGMYIFKIPAGSEVMRLVSRANRPLDLGINKDTRTLGFCIYKINAESESSDFKLAVAPDDISLAQGFYPVTKGASQRWTNGDAILPSLLLGNATENITLVIIGKGLAHYAISDLGHTGKSSGDMSNIHLNTQKMSTSTMEVAPKSLANTKLENLERLHDWPDYPLYISDKLNIKTMADMTVGIERMLASILEMEVDAIVGVPRSGLLAANLIALRLNLPLITTDELKHLGFDLYSKRVSRGARSKDVKRVLVIDDSLNTGKKLDQIKNDLKDLEKKIDIKYGVIYIIKPMIQAVDVYGEIVPIPRVFEWNFFHHSHTKEFLFDMDGVLCEDGPFEDDINTEAYTNHLISARQKYIPSQEIGAIVTNRLEKHRGLTEDWLLKHNVKYKKLIMCNLNSAQERRELKLHAAFKAKAYQLYGGRMFVESEIWQAREIARISGKPVFCTDSMTLLGSV
jgi:uncharacterized HAD superfamily protein/hypoxanthine phosphoribosyltransferase